MARGQSAAVKPATANDVVRLTGLSLLKSIADNNGLYLTQAEAAAEIANGNIEANLADTQGDRALCSLTAKGKAALNPPVAASKVSIEIDDDVVMPAEKKRTGRRGSKYPFDVLAVNQSFHVPKTAENPNPVAALASSLTGARRRFSTPMVDDNGKAVMETVKVKIYELDAAGKRVKGADGRWVVKSEAQNVQQKIISTRDFSVVEVGPEDKRGPGARVWRTK